MKKKSQAPKVPEQVNLTVRVPVPLLERIQQAAASKTMRQSDIVRVFLVDGLARLGVP